MYTNKKKNYTPLIWTLTIVINLLVVVLFFLPSKTWYQGQDLSFLPLVNACMNLATFVSLTLALFFIQRKNILWHKRFVFVAFFFTSIFLLSYLLYHATTPSTHYGGTGSVVYVYFFVLITHIFLAAIVVPLALFAMGYGLNMEVEKHKRIARWTMPIWMYVSFSGVLVYVMLLPYY